ncbi:hypothetical protein PENTCL1PPCAC_23652, partial [Pristionchus entomophagus]
RSERRPVRELVNMMGSEERTISRGMFGQRPLPTVFIHRLDGSIDTIAVPFEVMSRHYLFCMRAEGAIAGAITFEYIDEDEKVVVEEDIAYERFAALLSKEGSMEVYELREEEEEVDEWDEDGFDEPPPSALHTHHFSRIRSLGQGASGTCHLAINKRTGEKVAIKAIEWAEEASVRKQFKREVEALKKCAIVPNIVKLLGEMQEGPVKMLVFEFMDGGSLKNYGVLPPHVLSVVSYSLLDAITCMKHLKILHRDIKRDNVLVSFDGEVKLCDMGQSRILPPNSSVANSYVGDNYYMPPERLLGLKYRVPSEIWGWAVVLCECATGRHPFLREDESLPTDFMRIVERIKTAQAFTEAITAEYGQDLCQLISSNTHFDPATRWDIITLHQSPYITRSRTVEISEAGQWFADHPCHED